MHVTLLSPRRAQVKHGSKTYYVKQESEDTFVVDDGDEPKRLKAADFAGAVEQAIHGPSLYFTATPALRAQVINYTSNTFGPATAAPQQAPPWKDPRILGVVPLLGTGQYEYVFDDGTSPRYRIVAPDEADAVRQYDNYLAAKGATP